MVTYDMRLDWPSNFGAGNNERLINPYLLTFENLDGSQNEKCSTSYAESVPLKNETWCLDFFLITVEKVPPKEGRKTTLFILLFSKILEQILRALRGLTREQTIFLPNKVLLSGAFFSSRTEVGKFVKGGRREVKWRVKVKLFFAKSKAFMSGGAFINRLGDVTNTERKGYKGIQHHVSLNDSLIHNWINNLRWSMSIKRQDNS